ncbi:MAG: hypothetical protein ACT4PT_06085 [Methanobacteriota archaeon]
MLTDNGCSLIKPVPSEEAKEYLESLHCLDYDLGNHPVKKWSLIKEDYPKQSVVVPLNSECKGIINALRNQRPRQDYEANLVTKQLYRQLASYIITVPENCTRSGLRRFASDDSPFIIAEDLMEELYEWKTCASIGLKARRPVAPIGEQFV